MAQNTIDPDFAASCALLVIAALLWGGLVRLLSDTFNLGVPPGVVLSLTATVAVALIALFAIVRYRF